MSSIKKVLIANRGEIALRILSGPVRNWEFKQLQYIQPQIKILSMLG